MVTTRLDTERVTGRNKRRHRSRFISTSGAINGTNAFHSIFLRTLMSERMENTVFYVVDLSDSTGQHNSSSGEPIVNPEVSEWRRCSRQALRRTRIV